jgi:hypothetical protein
MSNSNESTRNPAVQSDTQPAMLSPDDVVRELRTLRERIPRPEATPASAMVRRQLAHVNADFVTASVNAAGVSEVVQKALGRSDEDLRQEIDAVGRWAAAIDEMRALLQSTITANTIRRQRIGLAALQTYQICQQLARDEGQQPRLAAHISEMRRLNRFGRTRRKPVEPGPAPQPQPEPQTKKQ